MTPRAFALWLTAFLLCLIAPAGAAAQSPPTGGTAYQPPAPPPPPPAPAPAPTAVAGAPGQPTVAGEVAVLLGDGTAAAPLNAPPQVQAAIWAANALQGKPYKYGGGHANVQDTGYDCSGTVSYALTAAGLLRRPRDSSGFLRFGAAGPGRWITVYTNPGHAYVVIAGLRLDTSAAGVSQRTPGVLPSSIQRGPRWRPALRDTTGFTARHPLLF